MLIEAIVIGGLGGALGLAPSPSAGRARHGPLHRREHGLVLPHFRIHEQTAMAAMILACSLGLIAGLLPAYRAARLNVIDSLRRAG